MSGVVGYVGKKKGKQFIIDALSKLQYRGHDGVGFACINNDKKISLIKEYGTVELFKKKLHTFEDDGYTGIGHIRWATVGEPSLKNAHPQINQFSTIACVHDGIIENYSALKHDLIKQGHYFDSQTDTQVIPYLFDNYVAMYDNLKTALKKLAQTLKGSFAIILLSEQYPDSLITLRNRSPLSILADDNGIFIASDFRAIARKKNNYGFFQPDQTFSIISPNEIQLYRYNSTRLPVYLHTIEITAPRYDNNLFGKKFNRLEEHLKNLFQRLFHDRILPEKSDEYSALINTLFISNSIHSPEQKYIQAILTALKHLKDGTYALCFNCGQPISDMVLAMHPQMSLCYHCNQKSEICA